MGHNDLDKQILYESVKTLVECDAPHIHLPQHKLYTLISIGFQYLLYCSTKNPGHYVLRFENHQLMERSCRKAKDPISKKLLAQIAQSRRWRYRQSTFHLDYFQMNSWAQLPPGKLKGALIVKDASPAPFADDPHSQEVQELQAVGVTLEERHYLISLQETAPQTIFIASEEEVPDTKQISFTFIENDSGKKPLDGVTINANLTFEDH